MGHECMNVGSRLVVVRVVLICYQLPHSAFYTMLFDQHQDHSKRASSGAVEHVMVVMRKLSSWGRSAVVFVFVPRFYFFSITVKNHHTTKSSHEIQLNQVVKVKCSIQYLSYYTLYVSHNHCAAIAHGLSARRGRVVLFFICQYCHPSNKSSCKKTNQSCISIPISHLYHIMRCLSLRLCGLCSCLSYFYFFQQIYHLHRYQHQYQTHEVR
jgi:hypothetical protein